MATDIDVWSAAAVEQQAKLMSLTMDDYNGAEVREPDTAPAPEPIGIRR